MEGLSHSIIFRERLYNHNYSELFHPNQLAFKASKNGTTFTGRSSVIFIEEIQLQENSIKTTKIFFKPVDVEIGESDGDDVHAKIRNCFLKKVSDFKLFKLNTKAAELSATQK